MNFHVVGLPHTRTSKEYLCCAYSQKILNFCKMMKSLGHTVYHYGAEGSNPECDEQIDVVSSVQQEQWFGNNNWKKDFFSAEFNVSKPYWITMNANAIHEISKRIQQRDFICLIGGHCQKPIADAFPNHLSVEYGIGYDGVFSKYKIFESYSWMHHVYGLIHQVDGNNYDGVVPNYFDVNDFPFSDKKEDYFLFVGRMIPRKGIIAAVETCNRIGTKLVLAGQGVKSYTPGHVETNDQVFDGNLEYVGTVDVKRRGELMSKARAIFVPTQYIGPFEGVHVEAMLCGTPVISTDWGIFTETIQNGVNGFRTRTLGEMILATKQVDSLNYSLIREMAIKRFSLDVVKYQYQEYFQRLLTLWQDGWYNEYV